MEEGLVPAIVVMALAAGALGGPDALRALLDHAGHSPVVHIAICVFVIGMFTAQLLGIVLLTRLVRKPRAQPRRARPRAPAADCLFTRMTLTVAVGVAFSVTACLVAVPGGCGSMSSVRSVFDFAGKSPVVVAGGGGFLLLCFTHLFRVLRQAGNADGAPRAAETRWTVCLTALPIAGICLLLVGEPARFVRLMKVTSLAVVCFTLAYFLLLIGEPGRKFDGGKHTCSV